VPKIKINEKNVLLAMAMDNLLSGKARIVEVRWWMKQDKMQD
jgi:hypothetical protein